MSEVVDYMDDAYQGEWDSMLDYAYDFIDSVYGDDIPEKLAEDYFDYDGFGLALHANGDLYAPHYARLGRPLRYRSGSPSVYDEMMDMSNKEVAEWYIYDLVGDLESALGKDLKLTLTINRLPATWNTTTTTLTASSSTATYKNMAQAKPC